MMTFNDDTGDIPVPEEKPFTSENNDDGNVGLFSKDDLDKIEGGDGEEREEAPQVVLDVDGNPVEKVSLGHREFKEFGRLLIEAFFLGNIREGAPDDVKDQIFGEIEAVCLLRGFDAFVNDIEKTGGNMSEVLGAYHRRVIARVQDAANALYSREKEAGPEGIRNPGDRAILDFCKRHGVKHMPDRPRDIEDLVNQLAEMMGVPQERINEIRQSIEDNKPTPGCNCDRCQELRRERGEDPIVEEDSGDEEVASL